jgi:hypothetical protein
MNANELAALLEVDSWYKLVTREEIAATLRQQQAENAELKATVRSFFEDFIDIREESDSGRVFAPITISSCRCMMIEPLAEVLAKMRTLSGAKKRSEE